MIKKYKVYVWDIDDWGPDFAGFNFKLFWEGDSFLMLLWKLYKAKQDTTTMVRLEWL